MIATEIKTNKVYNHLQYSDKRITVEQGGSRSGKTYNILVWLIFARCSVYGDAQVITIIRKSFPALRGSVYRDFLDILNLHGIYRESDHNKSNNEYHLNGWLVEFVSLDQPQKVRGRKRHTCFLNEANELNIEDFRQLALRTTHKIILDYNPSDQFHWIYDEVLPREDCEFFQTTYADNPFIDENTIKEIERYKDIDENFWRVYGLGERGQSKATIFTFTEVDNVPSTAKAISIGLDFGYTNDPTSIVQSFVDGDNIYFTELCYQTGLTNWDIDKKLKELELNPRDTIWADSSEPKSIEELYQLGWNVRPTQKGADSINAGIDMLKRYRIHITTNSYNMIKEFRNYKFIEDKNGQVLNKPVDAFNHAIDAARYSVWNSLSRPSYGKYAIR